MALSEGARAMPTSSISATAAKNVLNPATASTGLARPLCFLLVDDEPDVLSALATVCEREGPFSTLRATSAAEALTLIEEYPVDVVVCDQRMPLQTGIELLSHLRQHRPNIVRVLMSAEVDDRIQRLALKEGGVHAVIEKPWRLRTLMVSLQSAAAQARAARIAAARAARP